MKAKNKLHIGYFADGPWAHESFKKLITDDSIQIDFICVRYETRDPVLCGFAKKYDIKLFCVPNINSEDFIEQMRHINPDLFVSMSFNQIFKTTMINLPRLKTINCHAGKLPFYRGRNILNWALINDEKEFGITVHYIDEGIDTGDIILQDTYPITDEDDYGTLLEKAYTGCADILYRAIKLIQSGKATRTQQDTIDPVGLYCGIRTTGDEIINWNQSSRRIFNFVRAITRPAVGATTYLNGNEVKIYKVEMIPGAHEYINTPGQILKKDSEGIYVKTLDTMVKIVDYEAGCHIRVGDKFKNGSNILIGGGKHKYLDNYIDGAAA